MMNNAKNRPAAAGRNCGRRVKDLCYSRGWLVAQPLHESVQDSNKTRKSTMKHATRWLAGCLVACMFLGISGPLRAQATSKAATIAAGRGAASRPATRPFNRGQFSADYDYEIYAAPDRADGMYKSGEKITFKVTVTRKGQPITKGSVAYKFTINDLTEGEAGTAEIGEGGGATVQTAMKEPSCVVIRAEYKADGDAPIWVKSGAVIDANQIAPSMPAPDDFDAFWDSQKKRLAEVPLNPTLTPVEVSGLPASVEIFDVKVDCAGGAPVSGYLARPKGAKPKSLPIILHVQGAGVTGGDPKGPAWQAAGGRLVMDLNAHGLPNGKPEQYYKDLWNGELSNYFLRGWDDRESCYFLGMFLRLRRAMDFLCSQPEWDGKNLMVMGSSQGGAQSIAAAGLDERVNMFTADIPAMCDLTGTLAKRAGGWPFGRRAVDANWLKTMPYFDACNFAARTKAKAAISVGLIDETCPPAGGIAMFNQLKGTKFLFTGPNTGHGYTYGPPLGPGTGAIIKEMMAEALKK
jgi:cephalosporin-C deacetylase